MIQICGLFETETGCEKSIGSGHKFKLPRKLMVLNVTSEEDRGPLLNSCNSLNSFSRRRLA